MSLQLRGAAPAVASQSPGGPQDTLVTAGECDCHIHPVPLFPLSNSNDDSEVKLTSIY